MKAAAMSTSRRNFLNPLGPKALVDHDLAEPNAVPTNAAYAFTEQGVPMLASVLNNERAIGVGNLNMRASVRLRRVISTRMIT
jgi:hypothetical protein